MVKQQKLQTHVVVTAHDHKNMLHGPDTTEVCKIRTNKSSIIHTMVLVNTLADCIKLMSAHRRAQMAAVCCF